MGEEIKEKLIDAFEDVWRVFFARIKKNNVSMAARSQWVDEVDLFLPQIRALCLMRRYDGYPKIIYGSSYRRAKKIAHRLAKNYADMPPDLLDNFISLNDTEASQQLRGVTGLIFSEILKINNEGLLSVEEVHTDNTDHLKITLTLKECAECFGVTGAYVFSIDAKLEDDLNESITGKLRDIFETKGVALSGNALVTKRKENEWIITDEEKFIVSKEEGKLSIYKGVKHPICFYHAGTLTGIVSSLLDKELYGYETECCAAGGDECVFIIEDTREKHKKYLNPGKIEFSLDKRLKDTLESKNPRPIGNETDLRYYQLVILNSLIENPEWFRELSYKAGIEYGNELASFLQIYCNKKKEELFDEISRYYRSLKHLQIEPKGADEVRVKLVAELSSLPGEEFFLGFLCGELEGLLSVIRKEKTFENDDIVLTFKRQE